MHYCRTLAAALSVFSLQIINTIAMDKKECQGMEIRRTLEHLLNIKECKEQLGITAEIFTTDEWTCMLKCIVEKKLLGDDGKPHKENIMKLAHTVMPDPVKKVLMTSIGKCLDEFGSQTNQSEDSCTSYAALSQCFQGTLDEICKS